LRLTPCPECTTRGFSDRSRRRVHGGASPLQTTLEGSGSWFGTPLRGGRRKPLAGASPNLTYLRRRQGKGRWSRVSIDPCSSLVYPIARRVNSAIRERGFRDPHSRNSPPPWSRIATLTRLLSHNRFAAVVATLFMVELCGLLDGVAPSLDEVSDCPRTLEV
jgi:hypothetical protein